MNHPHHRPLSHYLLIFPIPLLVFAIIPTLLTAATAVTALSMATLSWNQIN
jgi:hypothetical protein